MRTATATSIVVQSAVAPNMRETDQTFMTRGLWGIGSTPPYMHDGRATTLTEAILEHGGEGQAAQAAFRALSVAQQQHVIAFLNNLVLFKAE